jgi:hypothetical protein
MVTISLPRSARRDRPCCRGKRLVLGMLVVFAAGTIIASRMRHPSETVARSNGWQQSRKDLIAANDQEEGLTIPPRTPTHTACRDESVQGIYHISMGDIGGAAGTIFYQFVIAQILYAERQNLVPWVHFSSVSHVVYDPLVHGTGRGVTVTAWTGRNATYVKRSGGHHRDYTPGPLNASASVRRATMQFSGTGVWGHYFDPVSDFEPGDESCVEKLYVTMDLYLITPGLHGYAEYAPRCWRYHYLPDYITKPHLGLTEWLAPQRAVANRVIQQYLRPRRHVQAAAQRVNPQCNIASPCLGLHIRHSDKASGRQVIPTANFLPYAQAFVRAAAAAAAATTNTVSSFHIYVATDSAQVLSEIQTTWPSAVRSVIRTAENGMKSVLRSNDSMAVFDLQGASLHHRANQEVLVEILALSQCQFLIHGLSAVSEAAIWTGLRLHNQSVNLEDPDRLTDAQFERLVQLVVTNDSSAREEWPRPMHSSDAWPDLYTRNSDAAASPLVPTGQSCKGYNGVLLIASVGRSESAGAGFFTSILNQILFAETHNLKPWVHLHSNGSNAFLYDAKVHGHGRMEYEMMEGVWVENGRLNGTKHMWYPHEVRHSIELSRKRFTVHGNGIWQSYLQPVSDFVPGDVSCRNVPLVELTEGQVVPGLHSFAPWSVRAWRYDTVPGAHWWNPSRNVLLREWMAPMRSLASRVVKQYYRFHPFLVQRAQQVNPVNGGSPPCLGLHLRNADKTGRYREKIKLQLFVPYLEAFERAGGRCVYVATDSHRALRFLRKSWPERWTRMLRSQGDKVVRTNKDWPAHYLEDHHRVNAEVLVDILALSQCQWLLHGFSTVSEAAIYLNPSLHTHSVNLEDPTRMSPDEFEELVSRSRSGMSQSAEDSA